MNDTLQNLVILQDLDGMIAESNNAEIVTKAEAMGFEINGLEKLVEAREELIKKIPQDVFNHYNRVRSRYGRAIAPVRENVCLGCFIKIPTQISSKEMGNQVLRNCENCGRYLYWV